MPPSQSIQRPQLLLGALHYNPHLGKTLRIFSLEPLPENMVWTLGELSTSAGCHTSPSRCHIRRASKVIKHG